MKRAYLYSFVILILSTALTWSTSYGDSIVFDNGVGGPANIDDASSSDLEINSFTADDFTLANSEFVTRVLWTGVFALDNIPPATDDFSILFYDDNAGSVGALNSTFNVGNNVNRTDTGVDLVASFDIYEFSASISGININAGQTYWVSIYNNTPGVTDDFFWTMINGDGNSQANDTGTWEAGNHRMDFQLAAIPEPSSMGLIVITFCIAASRRRNRKK